MVVRFEKPTWLLSPQGVTTGAFGLMGRTEEIARFGQLYLQKGVWNGRQLVPAAWIVEATAMQTSNGSAPRFGAPIPFRYRWPSYRSFGRAIRS